MNKKAELLDWSKVIDGLRYFEENERWEELLLVACAAFTGCRPSDFVNFTWDLFFEENGDLKQHVLIYERKPAHIMAAKGKVSKPRKVFLNKRFKEILTKCHSVHRIKYGNYLFGSRETKSKDEAAGICERTANRRLQRLALEIGLPKDVTSYSFRRTCARKIFDAQQSAGRDFFSSVQVVQQFLNHTDPRTTLHYLGLYDDQLKAVYDSLEL